MFIKMERLSPYQYFVLVVWESIWQILDAADYCTVNRFSPCETESACDQTQ